MQRTWVGYNLHVGLCVASEQLLWTSVQPEPYTIRPRPPSSRLGI